MCGIAGFVDKNCTMTSTALNANTNRMKEALAHRGPDGSGCWTDSHHCIGFAHTRLSIIDLSDAGAQPMIAKNLETVITYNGEIYNSSELREQLIEEGCTFQGHSDTEVILEACVNGEWRLP